MRWSEEFVDTREVVEDSNVVGHDDRQAVSFGECLSKVFAMALNCKRYGRRIESIRAVAHRAPAPAGAERKNLPKAIKQQIQTALVQMPLQHLRVSEWQGAGHPGSKAVSRGCSEISEFLSQQFGNV